MKIAATACVLIALVLGVDSGPVRGTETNDTPRVGQLREFDRFTFEGNNSFSARSLWSGLNSTFDFPELSHPLAPRDAFLAAIESQLRLGYVHCGFPDARITARYDDKADRVIVQINEGARYRCGLVEVVGAQKMPTWPIVEALSVTNACTDVQSQSFQFLDNAPANRTDALETNTTKIWVAGQPAHFDDISLRYLSGKVTNTLAKHGFFLSRFSLNVVTNAAARTAKLQVKILEEGPPATIDRINVTGNRRNSRETLLGYLGLKPGMAFTSDLAASINDRLYHSARFLTNSVEAGPPDPAGRSVLRIQVSEIDNGPSLNGHFEPMEATMLKARNWLARLDDSGEEAVFSASGYSDEAASVQCILAPHRGLFVMENVMAAGTNRLRHALIMSAGQIALYAPKLQQKFVAHLSTQQFRSSLAVETHALDSDGHYADFNARASMSSSEDATNAPPYALSVSLAPAAFVGLAHSTNSIHWFDGSQLINSNANYVLKLNAKTGRVIELTFRDPKRSHERASMYFETNAFASALAQVERAGAGFTNVYRTNTPFGSAISFFGSEIVQLPVVDSFFRTKLPAKTCDQLPALLLRLGAEDFLSPFENLTNLQSESDDPQANFEIPEDTGLNTGGTSGAVEAATQWILEGCDLIFPPRSWPWTVSRDIAFHFRGQQTYMQSDMVDIYNSEATGPIGYWVTAELLKCVDSPLSKIMAERGRQQLSIDAFHSDCRLLLDEHYVAGRFAARLAATLSDLTEQELDALVAPMPPAQAEFTRDCARRLRVARNGQPQFEMIAPALDTYWGKELEQSLDDQLRQIANE